MEDISEIIKPSSHVLLISSEENNQIPLVDPKTLGILETFSDD
jgi:hypothetical protein